MTDIYIKNPDLLNNKISKINKNKLFVISDFDRTLSKLFVDGKRHNSLIAQIRDVEYLGKDYSKKAFELYDNYSSYLKNVNLPFELKIKKVKEWWEQHIKLLVSYGLDKNIISKINNKRNIKLRFGVPEFLKKLNLNKIPFLIISSAVGDMIKFILEDNNCYYSNLNIFSNFFKYDSNNKVLGYNSKVVHSLSKSDVKVNTDFSNKIKDKKHIILIGDMISDIRMKDSFDYDVFISIGFLNENMDQKLENYMNNFDVVITNDGTFEEVLNIFNKIK
jgi:5'-nucleotidase